MATLTRAARETIKSHDVTIAAYTRHWWGQPDGKWHGDKCGCTDDRCIGYHHEQHDECGCLPALLATYAKDQAK